MERRLPPEDLDHILLRGKALWPALDGARVFVTGGTGFFGIWLTESLAFARDRLGLDLRATVLTRRPEQFRARFPHLGEHPALDWIGGNVRDFAFSPGHFTHLIHAATEASVQREDSTPLAHFDTIVAGSRRVLEFAVSAGVKDILLTSSGAVYGRQPPSLASIAEDYPGGPDTLSAKSSYAESKRAAELLCAMYQAQTGLAPKIARCFAFVGPHLPLDAHFAIGNFIGNALRSENILVKGDGTPYRSYLYAADLVIWLLTILIRGTPLRAYNVGSDEAVSIAELAERVARSMPSGQRVRIARAPGTAPPERYVPDVGRAKNELGLQIWHDLSESIRKTLAWHGAFAVH